MKRSVFLVVGTMLLATSLAGCGGSGSSSDDNKIVSDGRQITLRLNQRVSLGDNTYYTVQSVEDTRTVGSTTNVTIPAIAVAGSLTLPNSPARAQFNEVRYQDEQSVRVAYTGINYRFLLEDISPPRGNQEDRLNQEDFRLTFRITRVP